MAKKKIRRRKNLKAGNVLRQIRLKAKKTLAQIAKEIDVSIGCISSWERGITIVSEKNIDKVANAYGMTEEEKNQYIEFAFYPPDEDSPEPLTESQVFCGWITLPEESRKRILRAMNAYENLSQ